MPKILLLKDDEILAETLIELLEYEEIEITHVSIMSPRKIINFKNIYIPKW